MLENRTKEDIVTADGHVTNAQVGFTEGLMRDWREREPSQQ